MDAQHGRSASTFSITVLSSTKPNVVKLSVPILNVILSVITLDVVMLSVVAPLKVLISVGINAKRHYVYVESFTKNYGCEKFSSSALRLGVIKLFTSVIYILL